MATHDFEKNYADGISLLDIHAFIDAKENQVCAKNHLVACEFDISLVLEYMIQLPADSGEVLPFVYPVSVHHAAWDRAVKKHVNEG